MADQAPDKQISNDPTNPPRRFVVLHHTDHPTEPDHYDLMIEDDDGLLTWRVMQPPESITSDIAVDPLPRHRRAYLDYEGPVSNDHGYVRRHDLGTCTINDESSCLCVQFNGMRLSGNWVIKTQSGNSETTRLQRDN